MLGKWSLLLGELLSIRCRIVLQRLKGEHDLTAPNYHPSVPGIPVRVLLGQLLFLQCFPHLCMGSLKVMGAAGCIAHVMVWFLENPLGPQHSALGDEGHNGALCSLLLQAAFR